ncbi:ATP-binding protein [Paracoccus sp. Z330]|uniref:ATP-binding protein n=1 Tax=Paracoccus onchidii TaxID=3017813 RepID=A0ABT4ZJ23_9RHOB|nr:ATP-binding protein [Paracoccus onchidii]MDB6179368.1 ATP-binding protein [Paracoccus onchidii]
MTPVGRQNAGLTGAVTAQARPMFHRVLPASPESVRNTLSDIRKRFRTNVDEDAMGRLELVLAEVMNNVTEHAAAVPEGEVMDHLPSIHLSVVMHDSGLSCAISDDGVLLPDECIKPRGLPVMDDADLPEGGFGWYLIQDLTQALCYYREGQRNFLAFSIPFADVAHEVGA